MSSRGWELWMYVAACVSVPAVWGVLSAWVFDRFDRRRGAGEPPRPPIDYSI